MMVTVHNVRGKHCWLVSAGWQQSSSIKLLQSQLVAKKASLQQRAKRAIPNSSSQLTTTQSVNVSHEVCVASVSSLN